MNKGWIIALISLGAVTGGYLYYRSQKKAKLLTTIPAVAPTVAPMLAPTWLEALKAVIAPTPTVTETVSIAPTYVAPVPTYKAPAPKYSYKPVRAEEIPLDVRRLLRE